MNEEVHTAEWLISRLEGDTGASGLFDPNRSIKPTGAYYQIIPESRGLPAIRLSVYFSDDKMVIGQNRILVQLDWLIFLVNEGLEVAPLVPLVDRMDELLHEASGETSSLYVQSCTRLRPWSIIEPEDSGVQYRHLGGLYRTMVQSK